MFPRERISYSKHFPECACFLIQRRADFDHLAMMASLTFFQSIRSRSLDVIASR